METASLETTDIFRGAFLLASGGDLAEIRVASNGKRIATFLITGEGLDRLDRDYRCGRALVNPVHLRESLNHLRDVMFRELRKDDPPTLKLRRTGERTRYGDRKRDSRVHQTGR